MSLLSSLALQLRQPLTATEIDNTLHHVRRLYVAQLKEICKSLLLTTKGKRQDLIDRIDQHIRQCQVTGQNVRLLALRTIVLKMMTNDPVPNFENLYAALQSGLIDASLMADQLARLQHLANQVKGKPRIQNLATQMASHASRSGSHQSHSSHPSHTASSMPYSPHHKGPMLLFQSTIFYSLRRMLRRFPYVIPASKGRNLCNVMIELDQTELTLLRSDAHMKLYLFSGLLSDKDPARADIQFPPIEIHVDGINTKQYVKGLKGKAGTCRPADLTDSINGKKSFTVNIVYSDAAEPYSLYVYIVDARKPDEIVKYISTEKEHILAATTRLLIVKDYELNQDDDIVMATSSLTLRCPLTYARISVPMRSIDCDHIQCFDGLSFLTMQERIPSWVCPVCSKQLDPHRLAVSDYIKEILDSTSDEVDTVNINLDGSWETVDEETTRDDHIQQEQTLVVKEASVSRVEEPIEIISLDSESEDELPDVSMRSVTAEGEAAANSRSAYALQFTDLGESSGVQPSVSDNAPMSTGANDISPTIAPLDSTSDIRTTELSTNPMGTFNHEDHVLRRSSVSSDDRPIQTYLRRPRITLPDDDINDEDDIVHEVNASKVTGANPVADIAASATETPIVSPSVQETIGVPPSNSVSSRGANIPDAATGGGGSTEASSRLPQAINSTHSAQSSSEQLNSLEVARTNDVTVSGALPGVITSSLAGNDHSVAADVSIVSIPDASPKQNLGDSLETPKAKRLKIPTDPNYSLIDSICQNISRPASTGAQTEIQSSTPENRATSVPSLPTDSSVTTTPNVPNGPAAEITLSISPVNSASPATGTTSAPNRSPPLNKESDSSSNNQGGGLGTLHVPPIVRPSLSPPNLHSLTAHESNVVPSVLPAVSYERQLDQHRGSVAPPSETSTTNGQAHLPSLLAHQYLAEQHRAPDAGVNRSASLYSGTSGYSNRVADIMGPTTLPRPKDSSTQQHITHPSVPQQHAGLANGAESSHQNGNLAVYSRQFGPYGQVVGNGPVRPQYNPVRSPSDTPGSQSFRRLVLQSSVLINQYRANQTADPPSGNGTTLNAQYNDIGYNQQIQGQGLRSPTFFSPSEVERSQNASASLVGQQSVSSNEQRLPMYGYFSDNHSNEVPGLTRRATTGAISQNNPALAARYSKSPFDRVEERRGVIKVKGLLGIEVSQDILSSDTSRSTEAPPSISAPPSFNHGLAQMISSGTPPTTGLIQLPPMPQSRPQEVSAADKSMTMSPLDNRIQVMTLTTPSNAKRVISHEPVPERTWNKRLNLTGLKAKFDPATVNQTNIINLDDD